MPFLYPQVRSFWSFLSFWTFWSVWNLRLIRKVLLLPDGGEMAAQAMADVLFGDYNPSGKLAITMYAKTSSRIDDASLNHVMDGF